MAEFWQKLFDTSDFPARWHCGNWTTGLGWLHILSDVAIWGAYMAIPILLASMVLKRKDVPFYPVFWLFAAFIFSCGTTHLVEAGIFWWPNYRLSGLIKLTTAIVSWATVIALIPVLPKALALPRLGEVNNELHNALDATTKSEERLRHVFEAAPNGFVIVDGAGNIVFANTACAHIFGYGTNELLGQCIDMLVPMKHRGVHPEYRNSYLKSPETRPMGHGRDLFGRRKDGTEIPVEIGLNPIQSDEGTLVLASIVDITERKRAEQTLARYTAELERSNRELDEFAYVASHDLRTPLEGIENLAIWVQEDAASLLPDESQRHLTQIQQRAARLKTLLEDLLEYSRAGRLEESLREVNVYDLVTDIVAVISPPDGFDVNVASDLPAITTVETPLRHIFQNLIGNAIKHHGSDCGRIAVTGTMENGICTFTVSDDGQGIDAAFHDKIFMMFETLKPRDRVEGSGMGLALIKKLLDTYGGSITVESSLGAGTTFQFTWPCSMQELTSD